jgi:hypothetical protein
MLFKLPGHEVFVGSFKGISGFHAMRNADGVDIQLGKLSIVISKH